jgi:hypothetical protein
MRSPPLQLRALSLGPVSFVHSSKPTLTDLPVHFPSSTQAITATLGFSSFSPPTSRLPRTTPSRERRPDLGKSSFPLFPFLLISAAHEDADLVMVGTSSTSSVRPESSSWQPVTTLLRTERQPVRRRFLLPLLPPSPLCALFPASFSA